MSKFSRYAAMAAGVAFGITFVATPAWAPPPPPSDLDCMECVESEEIDGTLDANVLDPTVMVEGEDVSLLNNDAGYLVPGDFESFLGRVVFVTGDDTAVNNGTALLGAVSDIGTSGPCSSPGPSPTDPCLVKIGPGIFDLGSAILTMVDHTDIEGSGQGTTVITGSPPDLVTALLSGANAELRALTVENTKANNPLEVPVRAILTAGSDMRITHVTAIANGDDNFDRNVGIGVLGGSGAPILTHVTARTEPSTFTTARAIEVGDGSNPLLLDVVAISVDQALALVGGDADTVTVRNSLLRGANLSVHAPDIGTKVVNIHSSQLEGDVSSAGVNSTVNLSASQLDGTASEVSGGTINCVFVYNGSFAVHGC